MGIVARHKRAITTDFMEGVPPDFDTFEAHFSSTPSNHAGFRA
jgi:hypothetical protein